MVAPRIDVQLRPLYRVYFDEAATLEEYRDYLNTLHKLYANDKRYGLLIVPEKGAKMPSDQRKVQAEYLNAHGADIEARCAGVAFVVGSAIQRFIMSSVFLLSRLPCAYETFDNAERAEAWLKAQL